MIDIGCWKTFLDARLEVIKYFTEQGKSDHEICLTLSMTENQVYSIKKANNIL